MTGFLEKKSRFLYITSMYLRRFPLYRHLPLLILALLWAGALIELREIRDWAEASSGTEAVFFIQSADGNPGQASLERPHRSLQGKKISAVPALALQDLSSSLAYSPGILPPEKSISFPSGNHQSMLRSLESH